MTLSFKKTEKQIEAIKVLSKKETRYPMLFGGSRAGKTFIAIYAMIIRASKVKSRHVILRLRFSHVKRSVWLDTLPKVLSICFPDLKVSWDKSDYFLLFPNGSELWIGGLDDKDRVEKILGMEFSTIYFNESSQIPFRSVETALTRLAEKNDLVKKAYFDMNPPTKKHWSYQLWILGKHPITGDPVDQSKYSSIQMNPKDNIENIDEEYIREVLDKLSPDEQKRFRDGEFVDANDGTAYLSFERSVNIMEIPREVKIGQIMVGMDFNVNPMTAVVGYYTNKIFYAIDELYFEGDTHKMTQELKRKGYFPALVFPDSTGRNRRTSGRSDHLILQDAGFQIAPTNNPFVRDRVNNTNRLLRDGSIIIDPKCKKLINDLESVVWKNDNLFEGAEGNLTHISDALGYWTWHLDNLVYRTPSKISLR
jgi:PBSX family phage terminase large subunit